MNICIGIIPCSWKEPRLDFPTVSHALNTTRPLRQPNVAQAAPEQAALPAVFRKLPKCSEPAVHRGSVYTHAIIGAAHFETPGQQRRNPQRAHLRTPGLEKG